MLYTDPLSMNSCPLNELSVGQSFHGENVHEAKFSWDKVSKKIVPIVTGGVVWARGASVLFIGSMSAASKSNKSAGPFF